MTRRRSPAGGKAAPEQARELDARTLSELTALPDAGARRRWLRTQPWLTRPEGFQSLLDTAFRLAPQQPREALAVAELALSAARTLSVEDVLSARMQLARALYYNARYRRAARLLGETADRWQRRGRLREASTAWQWQAAPLNAMCLSEEALAAARRARKGFVRLGDRQGAARVAINMGNTYQQLNRLPEALELYRQAAAHFRRSGDTESQAVVDLNLALVHSLLGQLQRAERLFATARHGFEQLGQHVRVAKVDFNRGCELVSSGRYAEAWQLLRDARDRAEALTAQDLTASIDLELSELLLAMGATELALEHARSAQLSFERQQVPLHANRARCVEAAALARCGLGAAARAQLERAAGDLDQLGHRARAALTRLDLALLESGNDPARAARMARNAGRTLRREGLRNHAVRALLFEGTAMASRSPARADKLLRLARRQARSYGVPDIVWQCEAGLAALAERAGQVTAARRCYARAIDEVDRQRADLRRSLLGTALLADRMHVYRAAIGCWLEGDQVGGRAARRAFSLAERARSRELADSIAASQAPGPEASPSPGGQRSRAGRVRQRLDARYRRLLQHHGEQLTPEQAAAELEADERELLDTLGGSELLRMGVPAPVPSEQQLRAALGPRQQLVEYQELQGELWAFLVDRRRVRALRLGCQPEQLHQRLAELEYQIAKLNFGREFMARHQHTLCRACERLLAELGEMLLGALLEHLDSDSLVVVPTGRLHAVPFAALQVAGASLLDRLPLQLAPSAQAYALLRRRRRRARQPPLVVGVGDQSVPETRREAREVARLFAESTLLIGEAADRLSVLRKLPHRRLVHIATHSLFLEQRPMLSSLLLGDGWLSLHEIVGLRLSADLVTLASCHSGRTRVGVGDDPTGLAAGFLHAGARSVLVSLWPAEDRSARGLMRSFYRGYLRHGSKQAALRAAMAEQRSRHPHPCFWAGYALLGAA